MKIFSLLVLVSTVIGKKHYEDFAAQQSIKYTEKTERPKLLTLANGSPVDYVDASVSINRRVHDNQYLVQTLTGFNRKQIPERVVHAKGAGAFGYFEVTHDITDICKAKFLNQVNKRTPIAVRFSTIYPDLGGMDTVRDARGLAVKFYTEEGNFDLVTLITPVFAIKDPLYFPIFSEAIGRNPETNLIDDNLTWNFIVQRPESIFYFLLVFSDLGIPDGYRYMPGFSVHTYQILNKTGHSNFVRFTLTSDQGYKYLTPDEAASIGGMNPDYATKDLYNAIANGDYPSWTLKVQTLSLEDVENANFDVFDTTRDLPVEEYPPKPVGRLVLNRNPANYFAEVEQIAMCPVNLVPGILGAPDKLFEVRRFAYRDAQLHRLGAKFEDIPVNCPYRRTTCNVDGELNKKNGNCPTCCPYSDRGAEPYVEEKKVEHIELVQEDSVNFDRVVTFIDSLAEDKKERLIENIVQSLGKAGAEVQKRTLSLFRRIHAKFSQRLEKSLQRYKNKNRTENPYPDHYLTFNI